MKMEEDPFLLGFRPIFWGEMLKLQGGYIPKNGTQTLKGIFEKQQMYCTILRDFPKSNQCNLVWVGKK